MAKKKTESEPVGPCEKLPGSLRELAQQIFTKRDPVQLACKLFDDGSDAVKARTFENLAGWAWDRPAAGNRAAQPAGVRLIWDIPSRRPEPSAEESFES